MPRKKLSEYRAKVIISEVLGIPYAGWSIDTAADLTNQLEGVEASGPFAVKVDQAVKGRFKKGLVLLNISRDDLASAVGQLQSQGFRWLIIEPMSPHEASQERYLSLSQDRRGITLSFAKQGGIDIESHADTIENHSINEQTNWDELANQTGLSASGLRSIVEVFQGQFMVFLEINPYIVGEHPQLLDLAIEVDDAGDYFADHWSENDFRRPPGTTPTPQELTVIALDEKSPASFKLEIINPNGAVFLLLSGGGASIVVADEIYAKGFGEQLANYGEYSGNPNTEETYIYTKAVLELLVASSAPTKILFIGGAVANFTDIAATFTGIIEVIEEMSSALTEQHLKVYVRRGGPHQEIGLAKIKDALDKYGLLGAVHDPTTPLTAAVDEALDALHDHREEQ